MTRAVQGQHAAAVRQFSMDRGEVSVIVQRRMQQQHRRARALVCVGNVPKEVCIVGIRGSFH